MAIQREKVEQAHIVQLLRTIGGRVYVLGTRRRRGDFQGTMQSPGVPDLMAFLPARAHLAGAPRFVFIECKATGGRLRPEQQVFRDECTSAGLAHIVGDLDAVIAWLVAAGYVTAQQFPHYRRPKPLAARSL